MLAGRPTAACAEYGMVRAAAGLHSMREGRGQMGEGSRPTTTIHNPQCTCMRTYQEPQHAMGIPYKQLAQRGCAPQHPHPTSVHVFNTTADMTVPKQQDN